MHALTIRPIDRAALSGLCIPKMKTGDLRTDGEYHLAVDDASTRLNGSSFGSRASRLAMPAGAVCALIVVITMTTFNNTSPSFPPIGAARGNVSKEVPPDDMAQAEAANALSGLTERAADAVAKACAGTRTWCGECCIKRASHGGRGPRLDRFRSQLVASAITGRELNVAVVGNSVARENNFRTTRQLLEVLRQSAPNASVKLHYGEVMGGESLRVWAATIVDV
jgi:hypothetical protein